jgi:enoyl-CoA hydratase/carnithine racemase
LIRQEKVGMASNVSAGAEVLFEIVEERIAVVTLNRPEARNAINATAAARLAQIVREIEENDSIGVAILASAGDRAFCAGADLVEVSKGRGPLLVVGDAGFAGFTDAKRQKPWIAAVKGFTLAGGFELALACDMIVASEDARFGLPEPKVGLVAGAGGLYKVPRVLPRAIAIELALTGDPISAQRAAELGLINRLTPNGKTLEAALELARRIASNAPLSVRLSLRIIRRASEHSVDELRAISKEAMDATMASEDSKEGTRAFLEKRPARWLGR